MNRAVRQAMHSSVSAVLLLLLAGLTVGCRSKESAADAPPPAVLLGPADVVTATIGRVQSGPTLSGDLTPLREATIRARIGGAVLETLAESGERVSDGELLARLDTAALRDARRSAQSAVAEVRSRLEQAEREQRRQEVLLEAGAVAERAVEQAEQAVIAARAALASARAQLSSAEEQLGYAEVRAPFAGVVSARLASAGDVVQPGAELYQVVDPSSLELAALVATADLGQLSIGAPVEFAVNGFPDRTFRGALTRIDPTADPATRQVRVYAELPNAGGELVAGLFAEGRVAEQVAPAITVPAKPSTAAWAGRRCSGARQPGRAGRGRARPRGRARRADRDPPGGRAAATCCWWARPSSSPPARWSGSTKSAGSGQTGRDARRRAAGGRVALSISDFAIKRPIITVVTMLALVVFGLFALFQPRRRRVPGHRPARSSSSRVPYPGASPDRSSARWSSGSRKHSAASAGVDQITSTVAATASRTIIVQFVFARSPTRRRRTSATRSRASAATCRRRWRSRSSGGSIPPTCRSSRWRCSSTG